MKKHKSIALALALFICGSAIADTPTYKDCPAVNSIQKVSLGPNPSSPYYYFEAANAANINFKSFCENSQECGPDGSFRYPYDYQNALLNKTLTRYSPISNSLTCMYDMKNQRGNTFHIPLVSHNMPPLKQT